jgi:hypothetical protein
MSQTKQTQGSQRSGRRWTQWKEPEARKALAAWHRSGLSAAAFCAREGYSERRLRYWSERLAEHPTALSSVSPVSFVPVAVSEVQRARTLEIERGGVVLRVREDLDVEHVARLALALATVVPPC